MRIKKLLKDKNAEGVFGMSFSMIFSILLIIFFIAAAFIAIKFFLGFQRNAQIGMFLDDLQYEVDKAWESQSSGFIFNSTLPSGIEYVCFMNLSAEVENADAIEEEVYRNMRDSGASWKVNFAFWPIEEAGDFGFKIINHIQFPEDNPHCITIGKENVIGIKIEKNFGEALVRVG